MTSLAPDLAGNPPDGPVVPGGPAAAAEPLESVETAELLGRAPRERRRPALSPSRANDFMQCPLLFRFRVVDRLPEPPSSAAARGTLVHSVLERLYDAPLGERTLDAAQAMLPGEWERLQEAEPRYAELFAGDAPGAEGPGTGGVQAWLDGAGDLLGTYFTLEDPNRLEPAEREMFVETQLEDGPLLRGIVDRLDVAPNGAMRVVDYKTGKSPRPQYQGSALFQMRFYGLVLWRERGEIPKMLQLVYLGDGQVLRAEPQEADLVAVEEQVRDLWSAITSAARTGQWTPRRTPLCGWCAHQAICPQFGGTPPEIPDGAVELALGISPEAVAS
ncbi:PD-(D/E)XK nuclease family protein [Oerskovia sp. Sa1BUA8]|uniref:PD-(D/E)XK nuclease family protein n=1 Tax=Oerskovia douganii TaxID=2762210 RepID=A0A9D5UBG8_9CELL|nr:PD-(D/E)XK nuclease family protein [Oerskovia douganii]MBE7702034.1 PD-(D/E)XK nuclease family protein [Oerskovia douganii]